MLHTAFTLATICVYQCFLLLISRDRPHFLRLWCATPGNSTLQQKIVSTAPAAVLKACSCASRPWSSSCFSPSCFFSSTSVSSFSLRTSGQRSTGLSPTLSGTGVFLWLWPPLSLTRCAETVDLCPCRGAKSVEGTAEILFMSSNHGHHDEEVLKFYFFEIAFVREAPHTDYEIWHQLSRRLA